MSLLKAIHLVLISQHNNEYMASQERTGKQVSNFQQQPLYLATLKQNRGNNLKQVWDLKKIHPQRHWIMLKLGALWDWSLWTYAYSEKYGHEFQTEQSRDRRLHHHFEHGIIGKMLEGKFTLAHVTGICVPQNSMSKARHHLTPLPILTNVSFLSMDKSPILHWGSSSSTCKMASIQQIRCWTYSWVFQGQDTMKGICKK